MRRTNYRWPETVARLKAHPGKWVLTHQNVPVKAARRVRLRQHPALVVEGIIESRIVNRYLDEDHAERGTLWLRYTPRDTQLPQRGDGHAEENSPQPRGQDTHQ